MSFYRIGFEPLNEVINSLNSSNLATDAKKRAVDFVEALKNKGDLDQNKIITRIEYDLFARSENSPLNVTNEKNKWVFDLIDQKGEQLTTKKPEQPHLGPYFYAQEGINGLTADYQDKYRKIIDFGLKVDADKFFFSSERVMEVSERVMEVIDMAYERLLALQESKKTGIPIVVVLDDFVDNPLKAHGNQIARRDIQEKGLIPLKYDKLQGDDADVVSEVIDLKKKGFNIQSFNYSISQTKTLTVKDLKIALEKDGIVPAGVINDNGSNLLDYKSEIRNWLLNEKDVNNSDQTGLTKLLGYSLMNMDRKNILAFDKLSNACIKFVNGAGNKGAGTYSVYSFVKDAYSTGALDSSGKAAIYSSNVATNHAVVTGNKTFIYEQGGRIIYDYNSDGKADEEFLNTNKSFEFLELDKLQLAHTEAFSALEKHLVELINLENDILASSEPTNNSRIVKSVMTHFTAIDIILHGYIFKKEDLQNLAAKVKVSGFLERVARLEKHFEGDYVCTQDYSGSKLSFSEIKVSPSGKFQFVSKKPIKGTSFAAPAVAVELAQKGNSNQRFK